MKLHITIDLNDVVQTPNAVADQVASVASTIRNRGAVYGNGLFLELAEDAQEWPIRDLQVQENIVGEWKITK